MVFASNSLLGTTRVKMAEMSLSIETVKIGVLVIFAIFVVFVIFVISFTLRGR